MLGQGECFSPSIYETLNHPLLLIDIWPIGQMIKATGQNDNSPTLDLTFTTL